ncbi:MAG: N-6 DNA methylase [Nanoarchaeota archaeon]
MVIGNKKEQARTSLNALIRRYNENKHDDDFCKNESQISDSLIKPFVSLVLGYDTSNPSEFKVQSSMGGKRSDMLICLNGVTQFVIEAKSLIHDIRKDYHYYQQAIQYASYKEKKFAILTNFKHFIILDAEIETEPLKAEVALIDIENLRENDFDILLSFSKEIWMAKGENNEVLLKLKGKKKQKIDAQLLDDLKKWRELLHNSLKKHPLKNKYDFHEDANKIEEEIQKFIDRLVFICFCEDKQLMDVELKPVINEKDKYWDKQWHLLERIRKIFAVYREKYNSDLFNEDWCDRFYFDNSTLIKMLMDLRTPKEKQPYDFSVIEADILGKTYENFIGHVLTGEKRIKEKESKGKRKSEGIYYTPAYIVDYIVRNTVKEYIKGKSIASINKVKVLDPACGSGSFLIKAFDALIEECEKIRKLNYEEKKDLMLNCIFGVDKDERAVDICKLNLSLKLAERGQKLPELHNNIKCGDSLIEDENISPNKYFKWEEKFREIMQNDGFDVVIGNPPYGATQSKQEKDYLNKQYSDISKGEIETFALFYNKGLNLVSDGGLLGYITPDSWFTNLQFSLLRKKFLQNGNIIRILDSYKPFNDAKDTRCHILIFNKGTSYQDDVFVEVVEPKSCREDTLKIIKSYYVKRNSFFDWGEKQWHVYQTEKERNLIMKIASESRKLGDISIIKYGIRTGDNKKYLSSIQKDKENKKVVAGSDIDRYYFNWKPKYLIKTSNISEVYFSDKFFVDKIVVQYVRTNSLDPQARWLEATIINRDFLGLNSTTMILEDNPNFPLKFILVIINSRLMNRYYRLIYTDVNVKPAYLSELPIHESDDSIKRSILKLADKILSLNKNLKEIGDKSTLEKQKIQEEIKKTDNNIDELVYELYGITEQERKIIEGSLG